MSAGTRIPLHLADHIAKQVSDVLRPVVATLEVVGSVRRRRDTVGDIEFLAQPSFDLDLLGERTPSIEPVKAAMLKLGTWVKGGDRMMQVTDLLGRPGLKLDLYIVHPPSAIGSQLAIRTGPADLGHYVVMRMQYFGYRHTDGYAIKVSTGETVPTDTEEQFFALAGVPCVPPERRDELFARIWREHPPKGAARV